jgi:chemotaxis signal transduction protein
VSRDNPSKSASELRNEFDLSFALPREEEKEELERFVGVQASGQAYAFRVREIGGLAPARDVVPLPAGAAAPPGLLGLAGVQSALVPVFSLATLLGHAGPAEPRPQWFILCGRADDALLGPIAFGVSAFTGYLEAARIHVHASAPGNSSRHVRDVLEAGGAFHGVVSVPSLIQTIKKET